MDSTLKAIEDRYSNICQNTASPMRNYTYVSRVQSLPAPMLRFSFLSPLSRELFCNLSELRQEVLLVSCGLRTKDMGFLAVPNLEDV